MEGRIAENPTAELIREIKASGNSGALRLTKDRAKIVLYFEEGALVFAASNLRAHRLREVLKNGGIDEPHLDSHASDEELIEHLTSTGKLTAETLLSARTKQVSDILRLALLWTDGTWALDSRVRPSGEVRVEIDTGRLLLECARLLPFEIVKSRFQETNDSYRCATSNGPDGLLPAEAFLLSRTESWRPLTELTAISGLGEQDALRSIYALSLAGMLERTDWPSILAGPKAGESKAKPTHVTPGSRAAPPQSQPTDQIADVRILFARLGQAKDYYDVLDVGRAAETDEIKSAYHALALRFHPDRFHQGDPELRTQVESAFARIAQAYEVLSDPKQRTTYDKTKMRPAPRATTPPGSPSPLTKPAVNRRESVAPRPPAFSKPPVDSGAASRAEQSFQQGLNALRQNRQNDAMRFLAEAALLDPHQARYRAQYGYALINQVNMRRIAENELLAALSLEPQNAGFRIMLAELYQKLGLRRRAEGELNRALVDEPGNAAAMALLQAVKKM